MRRRLQVLTFILAILSTERAAAVAMGDTWTGAVCAALLAGSRAEHAGASDFFREVSEFRASLKPFAPDIRESGGHAVSFVLGDETKPKRRYIRFSTEAKQPALQEISYRGRGQPSADDLLRLAQRAFGIEFDLGKRSDGGFTYGYAIRGREAILKNLDTVELALASHAREARQFVDRQLPPYRLANLGGGAFAAFLVYKQTISPTFIDPLLVYAFAANQIDIGWRALVGQPGRSHLTDFAAHTRFVREAVSANVVDRSARAVLARNLQLDPDLIAVLKETEPSADDLREGIEWQAQHDRASWYEHLYVNLVHRHGGGSLYLPRGPHDDVALDDMFYFDHDGEPVHIVAARFFKDTPVYPKKPKETKEWAKEMEWRPTGA